MNDTPDTHEVVRPGDTVGRYMDRPEDEMDDDLTYETADEYPYRRDIVGGGELIETDYLVGAASPAEFTMLSPTMSVPDRSGAQYDVFVIKGHSGNRPRFVIQARPTTGYLPGQRAIAFSGQFRDQASLTADDLEPYSKPGGRTVYSHSDLENVFQPGYKLYHAGLVSSLGNGVLVADADKFNNSSHSDGLAGWLGMATL